MKTDPRAGMVSVTVAQSNGGFEVIPSDSHAPPVEAPSGVEGRQRGADEPLPPEVLVDAQTDRAHPPEQLKPCTRGVAVPLNEQPKEPK